MKLSALLAVPALALLAACASDPPAPPPAPPMAVAPVAPPAPPPMAAAPAMDGRYVGSGRLVSGPRSCARTLPVSAMVRGDTVTGMSGRRGIMLADTRMDGGMVMGSTSRGACRYDVTLRHAAAPARRPARRVTRARAR